MLSGCKKQLFYDDMLYTGICFINIDVKNLFKVPHCRSLENVMQF